MAISEAEKKNDRTVKIAKTVKPQGILIESRSPCSCILRPEQ
jgi:hypothetical protein